MYAIVRTGGKQYQVTSGDQLRVEKLMEMLVTQLNLMTY